MTGYCGDVDRSLFVDGPYRESPTMLPVHDEYNIPLLVLSFTVWQRPNNDSVYHELKQHGIFPSQGCNLNSPLSQICADLMVEHNNHTCKFFV